MSKPLSFQKLHNIRDLGGMQTCDGRHIKPGLLLRSGHLSGLERSDREALEKLVGMVIDFRTEKERLENPDDSLAGTTYQSISILDRLTEGLTREEEADRKIFAKFLTQPAQAKAYMIGMYSTFASENAVEGYAAFMKCLLQNTRKAVLWHCTAGKDRAGIAAALIEEILGVSRKDIVADYLKTNEYLKGDIEFLTRFIKKQAGTESSVADESLHFLLGADEAYINAYYAAVEKNYGSFDQMIRKGLRLTDEEIEALKNRYLS